MKSTKVPATPSRPVRPAEDGPPDGCQDPGHADGLVDFIHPTKGGRNDG